MSSRIPTARMISWWGTVPQLVLLAGLIAVFHLAGSDRPFLFGAVCYLSYSIVVRNLLPRAHRRGMALVHKENFQEAIPHFEESYSFFTRNHWIDLYRSITMLSPSRPSYREMALCNIGFCYSQLGNGERAVEYYSRALSEFPQSGMAMTSLRALTSVSNAHVQLQ